ncbi:hypothetical protein FJ444_15480 [Aestuariibacter sp. GS-14]|uniref:DUF6265 family protein n=1 Tax=Aestuariibacter sp. GS-14 TaxID=2590670 RepID=UPI001127B67A|nr:DUF6265 family protein [Aestuariibacter sp. GS-14]TPV56033.1 hypothetical protein FJ444_15480 [Aestuariibacter sp. GS-14]
MRALLVVLFIGLLNVDAEAHEPLPNVMQVDNQTPSPAATLEAVAWLAGHWRGNAFGGVVEEVWSTPLGDSMMGAFKLVVDDTVEFYELETIVEQEGSLVFRLKHFSGDLTGWEEKEESVDFRLVKLTDSTAYFNGLTLERMDDNTMNIYVAIEDNDKITEHKFHYTRVSTP